MMLKDLSESRQLLWILGELIGITALVLISAVFVGLVLMLA